MWSYAKAGLYEAVGRGLYRATAKAAAIVGRSLNTDGAGNAAPSGEIESKSEPGTVTGNGLDLLHHDRAGMAGGGT